LWGNATFTYDDYDNLKTSSVGGVLTTYTIDGGTNRAVSYLVGGSTHPIAYDTHGNVLGTDGLSLYNFNVADLMWRQGGSIVLTHRYDAFGLRAFTESSVNAIAPGSLSAPNDMATFYSQEGKLLFQQEAPTLMGASSYRYFYLGDQAVARQTKSSTGASPITTYMHNDALGSSLAETNNSGAVVATQHYDPFGKPQAPEPSGFGFAGQYYDLGGVMYMRARYYNVALGRFLSTDPILPNDSTGSNFNRYAYAANNPYAFTDPFGLCPEKSSTSTCIEAKFDNSESSGLDIELSEATTKTVLANLDAVKVGDEVTEKLVTIEGSASGDETIRQDPGTTTSKDIVGFTATATTTPNTIAIMHGHTANSRLVDQKSPGDAGVLASHGIPNVTVSSDATKAGVRELVDGRLQFRMLKGQMDPYEQKRIRDNLNAQQVLFYIRNGE
jgi:RHS repeat-associated protein